MLEQRLATLWGYENTFHFINFSRHAIILNLFDSCPEINWVWFISPFFAAPIDLGVTKLFHFWPSRVLGESIFASWHFFIHLYADKKGNWLTGRFLSITCFYNGRKSRLLFYVKGNTKAVCSIGIYFFLFSMFSGFKSSFFNFNILIRSY